MNDNQTTITEIKRATLDMALKKGWGDKNGIQNPQHVAMAMTVEMSELLEHFQWLDQSDVDKLLAGNDHERTALIGEEFADVLIYGFQLANALGIDVAAQIERKIGIVLKRK